MNTQHDITAGGQTLDPPTPPRKPHKLLWIDLETTALSRTEAKILEIGMIVTNLDGTEDGAAVRCFSDSGGASCDWEHIELKDKQ